MRIAVVTTFRAGELINFTREIALVKSASLYADTVEVLSFSSLVYTDWGGISPDEAAALRAALIGTNYAHDLPRFTTNSDRVAGDSGVNDLLPAIREGLVKINDRIPTVGDVWGAFLDEAIRYLNDPSYVVLLDEALSNIIEHAIRTGRVDQSAHQLGNAAEAVIGAGLIARLPAFTEIPMDEVLDLRRDLDGPLTRYRSAVAGLRQQEMDPYSAARESVVDLLWREQVAPALVDIEDELREHALVREIARSIGADIRSVVNGLPLRASLAVAAGNAFDLNGVIQAAAAGALGVVPPLVDANNARRAMLSDVQRRDFYYLFRLNQR